MASATCITSNGVQSMATPFKLASATCATRVGVASAASRVPWGGRAAPIARSPWLPPITVPLVLDGGRMNPVWYDAFREVFENRLGGVRGQSVTQVATTVQQTQAEVAATSNFAEQVSQYAQSVAATAAATAEVAANNSLSGAASIPDPAEPPSRADRFV
jgi:hypothetical protein